MSLYGAYDRYKMFDEIQSPITLQLGVLTQAQQAAHILWNLGLNTSMTTLITLGVPGNSQVVTTNSSGNVGFPSGKGIFMTNDALNTNAGTSSLTLTAANITGGLDSVFLQLTGTLAGAANAQLPTVASLVAALPGIQTGDTYYLTILNLSSGAFAWTVTTNTGWTLNGTMTIAQNFNREFIVTITNAATPTATLQSLGTFAQTAL